MFTDQERRADQAMAAIQATTDCNYRTDALDGLETDISDLLANVRHLCDRYRFDFDTIANHSETAYQGDFEDGPKAEPRDASTLKELDQGEPRQEALNVAVAALGYVLDNDYEYLSKEAHQMYLDAWHVLNPGLVG